MGSSQQRLGKLLQHHLWTQIFLLANVNRAQNSFKFLFFLFAYNLLAHSNGKHLFLFCERKKGKAEKF